MDECTWWHPRQVLNYFSVFNVQGVRPQTVQSSVPYVKDRLVEKHQLFMALTETWLHNHTDGEVYIEGYTLFRSDRIRKKARRGSFSGGVALYVRDDLAASIEPVLEISNGVNEVLAVHSQKENILICVVYRQPDDSRNGHNSSNEEFTQTITRIGETIHELPGCSPDIFLCGDFNLPHVTWPIGEIKGSATNEERLMLETLKGIMDEFFLKELIVTPTHKDGNVLDLLLTNNTELVHSYQCVPTLNEISHHYIVEVATSYKTIVDVNLNQSGSRGTLDDFNYFSENNKWAELNRVIGNHDWGMEFKDLTPCEKLDRFLSICHELSEKYVPKKRFAQGKKREKPPRERRILMRKRGKIQTRLKATTNKIKTLKLKDQLIRIERELQNSYKKKSENDEKNAIKAIKNNAKYFFSYAKKFSKIKAKIGPLLDKDQEYISDSKEMADILQVQYKSVFSEPRGEKKNPYDVGKEVRGGLNEISFNNDDIIEAIDEISATSAAGPDGYSAMFLKKCKMTIAKPLYMIWRSCLDHGVTPNIWILSYVVPIFKGGSKGDPVNYRPVSLTSHLIKICEKVIRKNIVSYMDELGLFNSSQHGFRSGRSCLSQLLTHFDKILSYLEQGINVDTVYLDFSKAFNKVDHGILLDKLKSIGIGGKVAKWIFSFLHDRKQVVIVNGKKSKCVPVLSGVPQGSVLGPLSFLIMMMDIDTDQKYSFLSSFADDTRVSKGITDIMDTFKLQRDLNAIYYWAAENNMEFNDCKFQHIKYGKDEEVSKLSKYLSSDGKLIENKPYVKDLGVLRGHSTQKLKKI